MIEHIVLNIVLVLILASASQWLAWRMRMPSILLLLFVGFLAGPVFQVVSPASLQGEWVYAFVSLSIGVILFEGGLSLKMGELREVGGVIRNLISVGVLVTWCLAGLAAYFILDFPPELAILTGALLTVTGPTVVMPLLRQVKPRGKVGVIARWEGITIDPAGAVLAVLVLEAILLLREPGGSGGTLEEAVLHTVTGLFGRILAGGIVSVAGAALLVLLMRRRLVPDYLQGTIALVVVLATFALADHLQHEAGLLSTTLLGIWMANQPWVPVRRISEFKENLQVLLLGCLFIVLSARLDLAALSALDWRVVAFLLVLVVLVRPVAVAISTFGTKLTLGERVFLAWLAPRGIVAAAVSSLFAFELEGVFPETQIGLLVPTVFVVIVGTVALYGTTIGPLARRLGLADPNAQGLLIVGANPWSIEIARAVQHLGFKVLLLDTNDKNVHQAKKRGVTAIDMDALYADSTDELDLFGIGRLLAVTSNDEVNSLAVMRFIEVFDSSEVYQLAAQTTSTAPDSPGLPLHLRGRTLFNNQTTYKDLSRWFEEGYDIQAITLTERISFDDLKNRLGDRAILLFVVRGGRFLLIQTPEAPLTPGRGDTVVFLAPEGADRTQVRIEAFFEDLITGAHVIDVIHPSTYAEIVSGVAPALVTDLAVDASVLERSFLETGRSGQMIVVNGIALPHCRVPAIHMPALALVRCKGGFNDRFVPGLEPEEEVYAFFFLVTNERNQAQHLRILAHLSTRIGSSGFMDRWLSATNEQQIKEILYPEGHAVTLEVGQELDREPFEGVLVAAAPVPHGIRIALLNRRGATIVPPPEMCIEVGDRLTFTGSPSILGQLQISGLREQAIETSS